MRLHLVLALLATVAVLAAGVVFTDARPRTWASDAQVVLVPEKTGADEASPLDSFTSGGTLGTSVELLSSPDLAAQVPQRGVTFKARAVTDSRVIAVHATGPRDAVRPALVSLLLRATPAQARLADRWTLVALTRPTAPAPGGPPTAALLAASALLALLTGVAVLVGAARLLPGLTQHRVRLRPRLPRRARHRSAARTPGPVGATAVAESAPPDR
jgi:hypothetical protein